MNLKTATIIPILLCVLVAVSLTVLKIYVWSTIGWNIIFLAMAVGVSIVLGGFNMFGLHKSIDEAKKSNELSRLANKAANGSNKIAEEAFLAAKEANKIAEQGILPDIEFKYELRELKTDYKDVKKSYYEYIKKNIDKYGRKYHHLILVNVGYGKAINWVDAYNWEPFVGDKRGFDYEMLPDGEILTHTNYLPVDKENIQIPAIIAQDDIYEDAKRLLIRIKYSDMLKNKHCKCKQFIRKKKERGFVQDSQKARYNIFHVNQPEDEHNRKKCADCCFDETIVKKEMP